RCFLSRRHQILVEPWLIWIIDSHTATLMGFRVCPNRPAERDVWLTFRWSIWHYDAPWWHARGIPDELIMPSELGALDDNCGPGRYIRSPRARRRAPRNAGAQAGRDARGAHRPHHAV